MSQKFMTFLPDLGSYLVEREITYPFKITVYGDVLLGVDRILGWVINGDNRKSMTSGTQTHPAPMIIKPMSFTIYLGQISQSEGQKIVHRLRTKGLLVVSRPDHKYLVSDSSQWVVPLEYLPLPPKNYPPLKISS